MDLSGKRPTSRVGDSPSSQPSPFNEEGAANSASNSRYGSIACPGVLALQFSTIVFISLCCLAGCQTTTVSTGPKPLVKSAAQQPAFTGDILDSLDPCGNRMQDLCGPLTGYYNMYHRGPATPEDLKPFAIPGQQIQSNCPVSGKPYTFVADGLEATGQNIRIYIYDSSPTHNGGRWCAIKQGGATPNQPVIMFADKLPEETFRRFRPATVQLP